MNLQTKMPATADEFLRWNEGREGKREFVRGKVVEMMINVTRDHWRLANRLTRQLAAQLPDDEYDVGSSDYGVQTTDGVRFPDVIVDHIGADGKSLATSAPVLLAEILSKSSVADDFGPKANDYMRLTSLQHYLTVSQDRVRVWVWSRDENHGWRKPEIVEASQVSLDIDGKYVLIDLAALYAGIAEAPSDKQ